MEPNPSQTQAIPRPMQTTPDNENQKQDSGKLEYGLYIEYSFATCIIVAALTLRLTSFTMYDWQTYVISIGSWIMTFLLSILLTRISDAIRRKQHRPPRKKIMATSGHLQELKRRLIVIAIFFVATFLTLYFNAQVLLDRLFEIGNDVGYKLVYISPQEILIQQLRVAMVTSIILCLPVISYEVAAFCIPAMEVKHAQIKVFAIALMGMGLFVLGLIFADKMLLPFTYSTLFDIGISAEIEAMVTVENYISFFITFMMCMGVIFELPLATILLSIIGVLRAKQMIGAFRIAIVVIFIVAALITPPDIVSQCMVAVPMILLYAVSIGLCFIFQRKRPQRPIAT